MTAISVSGLVVEYTTRSGVVRAVDGIDFSVAEGEVYALLGENGAGKTSTIEVLEGHRGRSAGAVHVLGCDPADGGSSARELRDRIGIVLQSSGVESELTVAEAVAVYSGVYRDPMGVDEVLDLVELSAAATVRVATLSGGQRRRLDLALGIVGRPEVLFLDEPTTGFDPAARRRAWDVVRALRSHGTTVILTTHYLDEAEQLADRIGVMSHGRIVHEGTADTIRGAGAQTTVAVRLDGEAVPAVLSEVAELAGDVTVNGGRHVFRTTRSSDLIAALVTAAARHTVSVDDWEVAAPSLEDAFIQMVADADGTTDE